MRRITPIVSALALAALAACGSTASTSGGEAAMAGNELGPSASPAVTTGARRSAESTGGAAAAPSGARAGAARTRPGDAAAVEDSAGGVDRAVGTELGPIEIGFMRTGVSNAAAFGVSIGNTVTEAAVIEALVEAYNDNGGIVGRQIVPVYADSDTASSSWDADFAAACAKFTEDNNVAAVLGYVFTYIESFEACLAARDVPHLSTSFNIPNASTLAQFPLWLAISTPLIENRSRAKVDGGLATGVLDADSRIGILIDPCPGTKEAWEQDTRPHMESKGLNIVSTFEVGCAYGSGDAGAEAGRAGNLVLQFRSAGVDTVLFMSVSEGPPLFVFANAAESQGYRPTYVVSSLAGTAILGDQIPVEQAKNVHGFGWLPSNDVKPTHYPPLTANAQRCISLLESKNIELAAPADYLYAFNTCEALFVYEEALRATGGVSDGRSVVAAIEGLGSSFNSAMNLDGRSVYGRLRHDAPALARSFTFDAACSCFKFGTLDVPIG